MYVPYTYNILFFFPHFSFYFHPSFLLENGGASYDAQYDARIYRGTGNRVLSARALLTVDGFVKKKEVKGDERDESFRTIYLSLFARGLRFTKSECSCLYSKDGNLA